MCGKSFAKRDTLNKHLNRKKVSSVFQHAEIDGKIHATRYPNLPAPTASNADSTSPPKPQFQQPSADESREAVDRPPDQRNELVSDDIPLPDCQNMQTLPSYPLAPASTNGKALLPDRHLPSNSIEVGIEESHIIRQHTPNMSLHTSESLLFQTWTTVSPTYLDSKVPEHDTALLLGPVILEDIWNANDDSIIDLVKCLRCDDVQCRLLSIDTSQLLKHETSMFSGIDDRLWICRHETCGDGYVRCSDLAHHQFEQHTEAFCERSGISKETTRELDKSSRLPLRQILLNDWDPHHTSFTRPSPEHQTIEDIVRSVRDTVHGHMSHGIDIDLDYFYAILVNDVRRRKWNDLLNLGAIIGGHVVKALESAKEKGIKQRDERERELRESLWVDFDLYELQRSIGQGEQLAHPDMWAALDKVGRKRERKVEAELNILDFISAMRANTRNDLSKQVDLKMEMLTESLSSAISAKEFCPSIHPGHTNSTSEYFQKVNPFLLLDSDGNYTVTNNRIID